MIVILLLCCAALVLLCCYSSSIVFPFLYLVITEGEVKAKYDDNVFELFLEVFSYLPLAVYVRYVQFGELIALILILIYKIERHSKIEDGF